MASEAPVETYDELKPFVESVRDHPELFWSGDEGIRESALHATKFVFDKAIASEPDASRHINTLLQTLQNYEDAPQTRSQAKAAKAGKSKPPPPPLPTFASTPLDALYLDGMNSDQVWEQLELRTKNIVQVLEAIVQPDVAGSDASSDYDREDAQAVLGEDDDAEDDDEDMDLDMDDIDKFNEVDSEEDDEDEDDEYGEGDEDVFEFRDDFDGLDEDEQEDDTIDQESIAPLRPGADELHPELDLDRPRGGRSLAASRRPAHPTLDDGFFSIDEFNRETEELESHSRSSGRLDEDEDDGDEDIDIFAPVDDEPQEAFDEEDADDLGSYNPSYKDFFLPPSKPAKPTASRPGKRSRNDADPEAEHASPSSKKTKTGEKKRAVTWNDSVRVKTIESRKNTPAERKALLRRLSGGAGALDDDDSDDDEDSEDDDADEDSDDEEGEEVDWDMERFDDVDGVEGEFPLNDEDDDEDEDDPDATESDPDLEDRSIGVETIQRLKSDLFDDEGSEAGDADSLSAYAKRQAALAAEIAEFEAENVGQKDWTLMGEATARARPKNSLLEEDLDFERSGGARSAPAVTEEATKSLEDKIKARILEGHYDDVERRRPIDEERPFMPSRLFELDGNKSSRSLAQIYEDDYSAAREGGEGVVDDRDGRLAKEHEELDKIWNGICYKLDALSNAHFTPKQPSATISTISNVATATLESALPTTASTSTLLAPEELLAPASSDIRDRSELTPAEKRAARTKDRKKRKKQSDAVKSFVSARGGPKVGGRTKSATARKEKDEALKSLVKNGKGVTVVGKESANLKRAGAAAGGAKGVKPGRAADRNSGPTHTSADAARWKL